MTTEAAVLGTPAIRCNSFVGKRDMGNFIELEKKYGLIFNFDSVEKQ
jgi:predicted glycosyltransferase